MKTKLMNSIHSITKQMVTKNSRMKEVLLHLAEEMGAWMLTGGFFLGIFWVAQIMFYGK